MTISFIGPRRSGKTTFALERFIKNRENTLFITPFSSQVSYLKNQAYVLLGDICTKCKQKITDKFIEENIMSIQDLIYKCGFYLERGRVPPTAFKNKILIFDEIDRCMVALFNCKVDTITGTMQRVDIEKHGSKIPIKDLEEMRKVMGEDDFQKEFVCEFDGPTMTRTEYEVRQEENDKETTRRKDELKKYLEELEVLEKESKTKKLWIPADSELKEGDLILEIRDRWVPCTLNKGKYFLIRRKK